MLSNQDEDVAAVKHDWGDLDGDGVVESLEDEVAGMISSWRSPDLIRGDIAVLEALVQITAQNRKGLDGDIVALEDALAKV